MKTTFIFSHNTASGTLLWVLRGIKTFRNHLTTYESEIKYEYNTQPLISFQVLGCSLRHWEGKFHKFQIHWVPRFKVLSKYWGWKDIQRISRDANASLFVNKETKILQNVLSYEGPIANTLKYFITPNVGLTILSARILSKEMSSKKQISGFTGLKCYHPLTVQTPGRLN